jgi:hypothetical protein
LIRIATGEKFIPKWNGNDKSDKPIMFALKYLTADEREQVNIIYVPFKSGKRGVSLKTDLREAFICGVKSIENLTAEIDGKEVEIKTPEDFLKYPMPEELYQEVAVRIKETSGVDIKN